MIDGDIDDFLEPKKDPYRYTSDADANALVRGFSPNQPKKDPKTGELV